MSAVEQRLYRLIRDYQLDPDGALGEAADLVSEIAAVIATGEVAPADAGVLVYERRIAAHRGKRRASGVFYTPPHVVDFVVDATLAGADFLASETTDNGHLTTAEFLASTNLGNRPAIFDPACGAGAFVLGIVRWVRKQTIFSRPDGKFAAKSVAAFSPIQLHAFDIDPVAVALCRLAVLLEIDAPVPAAPWAAEWIAGIVCRNSLLDHLADADEKTRQPISRFPSVPAVFNAVLGNPPWGQKGFRFAAADARQLRAHYQTARGPLDPFKLFIERALQVLCPGGVWGMVLPDIILLKNHEVARRLILDRSHIRWIVDAGRAFPGVNLDAVVIVGVQKNQELPQNSALVKTPQPSLPTSPSNQTEDAPNIKIWHSLPENWRKHPPPTHQISPSVFRQLDGNKFNIYLDDESFANLVALRRLPKLGDTFEIHEGVHSGNIRAKLFLRQKPAGDTPCAPLVVGGDELTRYRICWNGGWIDLSPGLCDRAAGEYANCGRPEWHIRPKIVVRRTGDRIIAAFDAHGRYVSNNAFVLLPRAAMTAGEMRAFVALLNSRFTTAYFRTVQPRKGRLFAELKIQHLRDFPCPEPFTWATHWNLLAMFVEHLETSNESTDFCLSDNPTIAPAINAIDKLVDSMFAEDASGDDTSSDQPRK